MQGDIVIRDAAGADLPALCALRDARAQHETKLAEAAAGTARFLVAERDGAIVAFASLALRHPLSGPRKSHVPKLSDCYVAAGSRSLGAGRALVAARERIAREEGCGLLHVSVDPVENPRWLEFFFGRGYRPMHAEPYRKSERRVLEDGTAVDVPGWRQDLVLDLRGVEPADPPHHTRGTRR